MNWMCDEVVSARDIKKFKKTYPDIDTDLQDVLINHSGGMPEKNIYVDKYGENSFHFLTIASKAPCSIYVFSDGEGLAFGLSGNGDILYTLHGRVYVYMHEEDKSYELAASFKEFFASLK